MRTLLLAVLMMTPLSTTSAILQADIAELDRELATRLANIGAPCTTQTDINEGTCELIVKKPNY